MHKTEFSKYLTEFMIETGYKLEYISTRTGASVAAVGFYKNGDRTPKNDFIDNFIKAFKVNEKEIREIISRDRTPKEILEKLDKLQNKFFKNKEIIDTDMELMTVPLYSSVSAGIGKIPDAIPVSYINIPKIPGEIFSIVVDGDSMENKIKKGDIIVVIEIMSSKNLHVCVKNIIIYENLFRRVESMHKTEFSKYLTEFMIETGYKLEYISTRTGASVAAVGFYKNGDRTPKNDFIDNFIKAFKVNEKEIREIISRDRTPKEILEKLDKLQNKFFKNKEIIDTDMELMTVPLYSSVSAGIGKTPVSYINIPKIPGEIFSIVVDGDSMENKIKKGDIIVVNKNEEVQLGDIGVFLLNGELGEAVVKRLKFKNGIHILESDNLVYEDIEINTKDITCCGKVVFVIKNDLKKDAHNLLTTQIENLNNEQRKIIKTVMARFEAINKEII